LSLTEHVAATHDGRNRRRERRWPADTETFQLLDERRFGEARRRRRLVPLRLHVAECDRRRAVAVNTVADLRLREDRFLLLELGDRIVAAFHIRAAEAGELDRLATRGEHGGLAVR